MRAATKKEATFGATLWAPEFLRLEKFEIQTLLHVLRDPLTTHAYLLMLAGSVFETGEFLGGYHDLIALSTPPKPERGARMPGPTYDQLRRVIKDLEGIALAMRDTTQNKLQGQLRLKLTARMKKRTPEQIQPKVQPKGKTQEKPAPMRVAEALPVDSTHELAHGVHGVNTSFNGSTDCDLSTTAGGFNRPPEGAQNGPHGPVTGQVEASPLMAADSAPELLTPQPPLHEGEQQPVFSSEGGISPAQAAKAAAVELKKWMAERASIPSKQKFSATKPMPTGTKPARTAGTVPPAAQKQNSMVPVGNLFSGP